MSTTTPAVSISTEELLDEIVQDVVRLTYTWTSFRFLFASEKKNVDALNCAGPGFFSMVQRLMFDDAVLRIAKLTDPAANRHQQNVSLERLLHTTGWEASDSARWQKYRAKLDEVETVCDPCRQHRHKRISHKDLAAFRKMLDLPTATLRMIDDALAALQSFVKEIYSEIHPNTQQSFFVVDGDRDVKHLMEHLLNRASQKKPDSVSLITYEAGSRDADFHCAFCGEKMPMRYYRDGLPSPGAIARWHFETCHGVVGFEQLAVEAVDVTGAERPQRFTVDLTLPLRETDP